MKNVILVFILLLPSFTQAEVVVAGPIWKNYVNKDNTGVYMDIIKSSLQLQDLSVSFEEVPFKRAVKWLELGRVDIVIGTYNKCKLDKLGLDFNIITPSYPISLEKTVIVFKNRPNLIWQGLGSLIDKRVAAIRGYGYDDVLSVDMKYLEFETHEQVWGMLNRNRVNFIVLDSLAVDAYVADYNVDINHYRVIPVIEDYTYPAFTNNPKGRLLAERYDVGFEALLKTDYLEKTYAKYHLKPPFSEYALDKTKLSCVL